MNYGLYLSAAGALTNLHRQDVIANNLANVNTVGFKPDAVNTRTRLPERLENPSFDSPQFLLERLGGGTLVDRTRIEMKQGSLLSSGRTLDLAIEGEGFFVVDASGRTGRQARPEDMRLTRDGRFTLDTNGRLVTIGGGHPVLDANGKPIVLDQSTDVAIDERGNLRQNGAVAAQLNVATPTDAAALTKVGANLLRLNTQLNPNVQLTAAAGRVQQGATEASAVDPIMALNQLIAASKAVQSNAKLMQYHDNIMSQAISTFGRVA